MADGDTSAEEPGSRPPDRDTSVERRGSRPDADTSVEGPRSRSRTGAIAAAALDPRRLLTFREVAHRGSFSRAAEALALTQPAVSQQIAALEREVGTPLLHRGPGGLTLTETGGLLLAHADALSERLDVVDAQ